MKTVPLTKIIATFAFSFMAIVLTNPYDIAVVVGVELLLFFLMGELRKQAKTLIAFIVFAAILGLIQYAVMGSLESAFEIALRMYAMSLIFLLLLVTTKIQDLTTALVDQCHIPYEYAFMFTAALRFIPDFIEESRAVREAQMCRGMDIDGSIMTRLASYASVVQPLVLRSLARSETMALSLELRGFGGSQHSFSNSVALSGRDYGYILMMLLGCAVALYVRLHPGISIV